jgi:Sortilin, neurotensin receptor 3, C-terminal
MGECKLIDGLAKPDGMDICRNDPNAVEWYDITGYRKIPISTCHGGDEMQFAAPSHPCPGHEEQYEEKHRISGVALFFAIALPLLAAAAVGWYVWRNWDGKFGQIRLGDGSSFGGSSGESPWIKWPVAAISAVVAVVAAIPLLAASLWRTVRNIFPGRGGAYGRVPTYASRSSFARGRGDYSAVEDEGELLGEDSDEEV